MPARMKTTFGTDRIPPIARVGRTLLCLSLSLSFLSAPLQPAQSSEGKKTKSAAHNKKAGGKPVDGANTGLDGVTLQLANRGEWKEVEARLEARIAGGDSTSRDASWLAFTYMFLGDCDKLHALADKTRSVFSVASMPTTSVTTASVTAASSTLATTSTSSSASSTSAPTSTSLSSSGSTVSTPTSAANSTEKNASTVAASSTVTTAVKVDATKETSVAGANVDATSTVKTASNPQEINALIVQAYDDICSQKYAAAEQKLAAVPTWFRYDALVNFTLAALKGKQGRPIDAIDFMQRTAGAAPEFAWAYRTLGKLHQNRTKDLQKAEEAYKAALAIEPSLSEVVDALVDIRLQQNNFDGAIDAATDAIKASPNQSENYFRLAQILIQQWRLREALVQLGKSLTLDPEQARYFRTSAMIKRYQGELNDAIADQQKAVDLSKDKTFELIQLATMNQSVGNVNRAADNLLEAVKLDPNNQDAHDKLCALLEQEKRYDDLATEYQRFIVLRPKDARGRIAYARALLAQGKADKAIVFLKEAANLEPTNPDPHREIGAIKLKARDFLGAAKEYTFALNINPSSVTDLVSLGYAYAQNDDYAQAEAAFVTAIALQSLTQPNTLRTSPERLNLMRALAVLLMDEGRYSEAASQFEAIYGSSKGSDSQSLDAFRLAQAKALRDLSSDAAKAMIDAYGRLSADERQRERAYLISTLLEGKRPVFALPIIEEYSTSTDSGAKLMATMFRARALLLQDKAADASKMVAGIVPEGSTDSGVSEEYVTLSQIAAANNDLALADTLGTKAIEKYPKNYKAFVQVGKVCLKQGKSADALNFAKRALELNQYCTGAYILMGDAQLKAGNFKDASASYRRAAELYPGLIEAHKGLLETLRKLSLKDDAKREEDQIAQMEKIQ